MAVTMMQLLTGLIGIVGCMVCMSLVRIVIGISAVITAMGVTQQSAMLCMEGSESKRAETTFLLIFLCIHLTVNFLFGRVAHGNLNYAMCSDIIDWIGNLIEYGFAIHLLRYFKTINKCIESTDSVNVSMFMYNPKVVWDLFVVWIAFDTILFLFRILITYILYRKMKSKGHQTKYVLQ